jgi:hypothetical protein
VIASSGSGQQARTQSVKQAANRPGSIRFIMMLSQAPREPPNGRAGTAARIRDRRFPNRNGVEAVALGDRGADAHQQNLVQLATLSGLRLSSIREKWSSRSRKPEGRAGSQDKTSMSRLRIRSP